MFCGSAVGSPSGRGCPDRSPSTSPAMMVREVSVEISSCCEGNQ